LSGDDGLAAFYRARLDEDEAAANAATPGEWAALDGGVMSIANDTQWPVSGTESDRDRADRVHIARHDPDSTLRDIEADRLLLAAYEAVLAECHSMLHDRRPRKYGEHDGLHKAVRIRAARFSGHPDYQAGWKP
jgi:hypothetical protein